MLSWGKTAADPNKEADAWSLELRSRENLNRK